MVLFVIKHYQTKTKSKSSEAYVKNMLTSRLLSIRTIVNPQCFFINTLHPF